MNKRNLRRRGLVMDDYAVGWGAYACGALLLFLVWWQIVKILPGRGVRDVARSMMVVALAVPVTVPLHPGMLAPAWTVALSEGLLQEHGNPLPAVVLLLAAGVLASFVLLLWRWRFGGNRRAH